MACKIKHMKSAFIFAVVVLLVFSCGEEKKAEITNPNGMSEMSLIMEDWYNQLAEYSKSLKAGDQIKTFVPLDEKNIYTAEVSKEKDNVHGEQFNAFTESFFYNYNNIGKGKNYAEQVEAFNLSVTACINCHEQHCQGPIVRIRKLTVPKK